MRLPYSNDKKTRRVEGTGRTNGAALPMIIRPEPLRLADIERRLRDEPDLAWAVRTRPAFCATLAHALMRRDEHARARFADHHDLGRHLVESSFAASAAGRDGDGTTTGRRGA